MEHRTKRNHPRIDLIAEYESMNESGDLGYLEENDFHQLINYYEDEFLIEQAIEVADYAINQHPFCVDFLMIKARLLLSDDKPYRAMQFLDQAEVMSPYELDVYLLRARVFSAIGEAEQAKTLLDDAEKFSPGSEDRIEIYLCEAAIHENIKDFDRMFSALSKALREDPSNVEALERVWVSVELSKKYEESITLHLELLENDSYLFQAWFNLGHAYSCMGEYRKAIEALEYSFLINADFELGYLDCAELCCQERLFGKALDIYQEMHSRFGADSDDMVKMAECQFEMKQIDESMETLVKAMRMDSYNDEVFYFIGKCFVAQNKLHNAKGAFIKAIELEDRREEYYAELANVYAKLNELGKADFYFRKATEIGPEQEYYWVQHCRFLISVREYEKALEVNEEADQHTFGAELIYCKAICLFKLDEKRKALKVLDEALVEQFSQHTIMYDLCPEFRQDAEIESIVKYYKGEFVQTH